MKNKFNVGDRVIAFGLQGEIVSIQSLPKSTIAFLELETGEVVDDLFYRIKISDHEYLTTSEDNLTEVQLNPERITDEE